MSTGMRAVLAVAALVACSPQAAVAQGQTKRWDISAASGVGLLEVEGRRFGVPYVGFWAARQKSARLELVYQGFMLGPIAKQWVPRPIGFEPGVNMAGTSTRAADAVAFGALVGVNYYFRQGAVRPYLTIGAGLVINHRSRESSRVVREPPDGLPTSTVRRDSELLIGLNSIVGLGMKVRVAREWYVRPEARIPFPWLPPPGLGHPALSVALVVGVTYSPQGR